MKARNLYLATIIPSLVAKQCGYNALTAMQCH